MDNYTDIDKLLNGVFDAEMSLQEHFEARIKQLDIAPTTVLKLLGVGQATLNGILTGKQKQVDFTNLIKLSNFLEMPIEKVIKLFVSSIANEHDIKSISSDKIEFIKNNFDLTILKKAGFINSISDYDEIEQRIVSRLGLKSIFEYRQPNLDVAFSSGRFNSKNEKTRFFWIKAAIAVFEELDNPNEFNREELIKFFPKLRWYSTNEQQGLNEVIKILYQIGVTVIYQPQLPTLQLRGATLSYNDKPCIVITNYVGLYPTLWFALVHELYHVLFDFEEIKNNAYHLSDDINEDLTVIERENEANNFAREYLFGKEKLDQIKSKMTDFDFVRDFALANNVHPSIVYSFYAFERKIDAKAWARTRRYSPDVNSITKSLQLDWSSVHSLENIINEQRNLRIYN